MIKDIFKLKKKSWHMSLMTWTWGYDYTDFPNMCPYFWLSVLNVLISPFVVILKTFVIIGGMIENYSRDYDRKCKIKEEQYINNLLKEIRENPDGFMARKLISSKVDYDLGKRYSKRFLSVWWKTHNDLYNTPVWTNYSKEYDRRSKLKYDEKAVKEAKPKTKRQIIGEDTVLIKKVAKGVGVLLALVILYSLYLLATLVDWSAVGIVMLKIIGIIVVGLIGTGIVFSTVKFLIVPLWCKYGDFCIPCEERREGVANFFTTIGKGIIWPFIWIGKGIATLWDIGMALKDDNCPAIDWED